MEFSGSGKALAVASILACLFFLCLAASPLRAQQGEMHATRIIALGSLNTASIQPLAVLASQEETTPAFPASANANGLLPEEEGNPSPLTAPAQAAAAAPRETGPDGGGAAPAATPATGKLFGDQDAASLFGTRGGYFHPSVLLQEEWTDNLYNLKLVQQSNALTTVSPGLWVGFPRMEDPPINFNTSNSAVGGNRFLVTDTQSYERLLAYLSGRMDHKTYSAASALDYNAWRVEGYARYQMPSGFTLHVLDRVTSDRDRFDRGSFPLPNAAFIEDDPDLFLTTPQPWDFVSNLVNAELQYEMGDRYTVKLDYTNFLLTYEGGTNAWLNRTDNNLALSLYYHYSPKTSLFAEYSFADVTYDEFGTNDSTNTFYYGGVSWKGAKISVTAKGGYHGKEFETDPMTAGTFSMESLFDYLVTDKTKISFTVYKAFEETNTQLDRGMDTLAGTLRYEQRFTYRLKGGCEATYELNDHTGFARTGLDLPEEAREDTTFSVRPTIEYSFRDWLAAGVAYTYEQRNSSDSRYDYTTQTVTLGLNFSL